MNSRRLYAAFCIMALMVSPVAAQSFGQRLTAPPSRLQIFLRFSILPDFNNEAVLDQQTGLIWQRTPTGTGDGLDPGGSNIPRSWQRVLAVCHAAVHTGLRWGWRVPSVEELLTLVDAAANTSGALPAGSPFQNVFGPYWTATTFERIPGLAYAVSFNSPFAANSPVSAFDKIAFP